MAIPTKRYRHEGISYLDLAEIRALLRAPDRSLWLGRRDHALLLTMVQTGVRVSELTTLRVRDVNLATAAHVQVTGKGSICRSRHMAPYVASRTMLRKALAAGVCVGTGC